MSRNKPIVARCPECDARIRFFTMPFQGEFVPCPECDTGLEVVQTMPLRLYWAFDEDSDAYEDGDVAADEYSVHFDDGDYYVVDFDDDP